MAQSGTARALRARFLRDISVQIRAVAYFLRDLSYLELVRIADEVIFLSFGLEEGKPPHPLGKYDYMINWLRPTPS